MLDHTPTFFSIIIPVHNCETFIQDCLESVINQTYRDYEIIIIDDGSTDRSVSICETIGENDNRVNLIKETWGGVSRARNIGLNHAYGKYVLFIDSDDILLPDALCTYKDAIQKTSADIIKFGYETVLIDGSLSTTSIDNPKLIHGGDSIEMLKATEESGYCGFLWDTAFRREIIQELRFDEDIALYEDHIFSRKAFMRSESMFLGGDVVYRYFKRDTPSLGKNQDPIMFAKSAIRENESKLTIIQGNDKALAQAFNHQLYGRISLAIYSWIKSDRRKRDRSNFTHIVSEGIKGKPFGKLHLMIVFVSLAFKRIAKH